MIKVLEESDSRLVTINNNIVSTIFIVVGIISGMILVMFNLKNMNGVGIYVFFALLAVLIIVILMFFSIRVEVDKSSASLLYIKKRVWGVTTRTIAFQDIVNIETQRRMQRNVSQDKNGRREVTETVIISDVLHIKNGEELVISRQKKQLKLLNVPGVMDVNIGGKVAAYIGVPYLTDNPMDSIKNMVTNVTEGISL